MKLTATQLAILRFIELADGEGSTLARDIADQLDISTRGMGGRLSGLWMHGLLARVVVKNAATPRSDTLYGWVLTDAGREAIASSEAGSRSRILAAADGPKPIEQVRQRRSA